MTVDGRAFTTYGDIDNSATTLLELTPDGFVQRAEYPGVVDEIVRVR